MKKFLLSIILMLALFAVNAQTTMPETDPAGNTSTVNTNADTSYHTLELNGEVNTFDIITITVKGTKTSGTVAGAITLWVSNDNSRWFAGYGKTTEAAADTTHSIALTDASVSNFYQIDKTRWRYYRVRVITSGTQVSSYDCALMGRKEPKPR